jgi:hypothetical protein
LNSGACSPTWRAESTSASSIARISLVRFLIIVGHFSRSIVTSSSSSSLSDDDPFSLQG